MNDYNECPNCGGPLRTEKAGGYSACGAHGTWLTTTAWRCTGDCNALFLNNPHTNDEQSDDSVRRQRRRGRPRRRRQPTPG